MTPSRLFLYLPLQSHIFIIGCQKDLGAPFAGLLLLVVKGFLEEFGTLLKHEFVDSRQVGGIIPYRIFHKQDGLYPNAGCLPLHSWVFNSLTMARISLHSHAS